MCKDCEEHRHFVCECGKVFDNALKHGIKTVRISSKERIEDRLASIFNHDFQLAGTVIG